MTYLGSALHKSNLAKARDKALALKVPCHRCNKEFSSNGLPHHEKACSLGQSCPVCGKWFFTKGVTCSHGCANTYFRSGSSNGNWKESTYRTTCFDAHGKACLICGEMNIVEAHHVNGNREDNRVANLVPLCPTHHCYWHHSKFKHLVEPQITKYLEDWE